MNPIPSVSFFISLLSFYLAVLSFGENGVLRSPTISVSRLMCDLSFSNVSFTNVGALVLWHSLGLRLHLDTFLPMVNMKSPSSFPWLFLI